LRLWYRFLIGKNYYKIFIILSLPDILATDEFKLGHVMIKRAQNVYSQITPVAFPVNFGHSRPGLLKQNVDPRLQIDLQRFVEVSLEPVAGSDVFKVENPVLFFKVRKFLVGNIRICDNIDHVILCLSNVRPEKAIRTQRSKLFIGLVPNPLKIKNSVYGQSNFIRSKCDMNKQAKIKQFTS